MILLLTGSSSATSTCNRSGLVVEGTVVGDVDGGSAVEGGGAVEAAFDGSVTDSTREKYD